MENILFASKLSYLVKIVDFGIAGVNTINVEKIKIGSLRYMAPEVLLGKSKRVGPSIDI